MDHHQIDNIIDQLSIDQFSKDFPFTIARYESLIKQLCPVAVNIFSKEPSLLELQAPIMIAGDLQYTEPLKSTFTNSGSPNKLNYLFLGNYIDQRRNCLHTAYGESPPKSNRLYSASYAVQRGNCLHTILLLLALKIKHPENYFFVKGNLDARTQRIYVDEFDKMVKIDSSSECILYDCLNSLPVAALINDKIICTHGRLSPDLHDLDQIRHINRTNSIHSSLLLDLLGPRSRNPHSVDDIFVAEELQFLEKHDLHIICCSPRQVGSNEKDFAEQRVVSISSSSYSASQASFIVMIVNANLKCVFRDLHQKSSPLWSYQISRAATEFKVAETSKPNFGSGSESESKPGINASEFDFDPTSLYKSEFRGVKRFLGARV